MRPLTHTEKLAIDAQVRKELGERPVAPKCPMHLSYAPHSDDGLMKLSADYFAGLGACSDWDRAFRKRFREIEASFACPCDGTGRIYNNADTTSGQFIECGCSALSLEEAA